MRKEIRFSVGADKFVAKYFYNVDTEPTSGYDIYLDSGDQETFVNSYYGDLDEINDTFSNDYKQFYEFYLDQDLTLL